MKKTLPPAWINLGGNVLTLGDKPDGSNYNIGIQKPFSDDGTAIASVEVSDETVVSSGVYERYFYVGDNFYHHILNPKTGYPYDNNLLGVTIICPKSVDGDGLSTTCFALGLEDGMKLIESLDDTEAIFITDQLRTSYHFRHRQQYSISWNVNIILLLLHNHIVDPDFLLYHNISDDAFYNLYQLTG